jgi:hypothetical protein
MIVENRTSELTSVFRSGWIHDIECGSYFLDKGILYINMNVTVCKFCGLRVCFRLNDVNIFLYQWGEFISNDSATKFSTLDFFSSNKFPEAVIHGIKAFSSYSPILIVDFRALGVNDTACTTVFFVRYRGSPLKFIWLCSCGVEPFTYINVFARYNIPLKGIVSRDGLSTKTIGV